MSVVLQYKITIGFHAAVFWWPSGFPYRDIRDLLKIDSEKKMCGSMSVTCNLNHYDTHHISSKSENALTKCCGHPKPILISRSTLNVVCWIDTTEMVTCKCKVLRKIFWGFYFITLFIAKKIDAFKQECKNLRMTIRVQRYGPSPPLSCLQ